MKIQEQIIADEIVIDKIVVIRGQKVMLDYDLAELYGVKTKVLKQTVRRNLKRFPVDFMFELSQKEFEVLRSQFVTSRLGDMRTIHMVNKFLTRVESGFSTWLNNFLRPLAQMRKRTLVNR